MLPVGCTIEKLDSSDIIDNFPSPKSENPSALSIIGVQISDVTVARPGFIVSPGRHGNQRYT